MVSIPGVSECVESTPVRGNLTSVLEEVSWEWICKGGRGIQQREQHIQRRPLRTVCLAWLTWLEDGGQSRVA